MRKPLTSSSSRSLGTLTNWKIQPGGMCGETDHGRFNVIVYNDRIIRISATRDESFEDFSYAVVATPQSDNYTVTEHHDVIEIRTDVLILTITKSPVRFSFRTIDQQLINEDDPASEPVGTGNR